MGLSGIFFCLRTGQIALCMGYTQQQAAQALGVSLRTVKAWEAGFAAPPAFLALACAALAAGLGPWVVVPLRQK